MDRVYDENRWARAARAFGCMLGLVVVLVAVPASAETGMTFTIEEVEREEAIEEAATGPRSAADLPWYERLTADWWPGEERWSDGGDLAMALLTGDLWSGRGASLDWKITFAIWLVSWLDAQSYAMLWALPEERPWPLDAEGRPIVTTRRLDFLTHVVGEYDSRWRIRRRYHMRWRELERLNPEVDLGELEVGQELVVWKRDNEDVSQSRRRANGGRLLDGEPLPEGPNYRVLSSHRAFGTYYTVGEIVRVMDAFHRTYPDSETNPLVVGDLSYRHGREIAPHRSHQSGRDADISYPRIDRPPTYRHFHGFPSYKLDVERTFWLLREFIRGGHVEYIFVDRDWQRLLYREAKRQGAPEGWVERVFQYPGWASRGIIRDSPGHHDHFHIRFRCQHTDRWCR